MGRLDMCQRKCKVSSGVVCIVILTSLSGIGSGFVTKSSTSNNNSSDSSSSSSASKVRLSKHPVLIVISYDGFRYDYLDKGETPHLHSVKRKGVSVPWMTNQFLTNTFPNHFSIATGLHLESHGIVANYFFDPLYNTMLSGYENAPGFWNYSTSVVPAWVLNEWAGDGRASGVMMWPGSGEPYGENKTLSTYIKKYDGPYPFEGRVDDVISWITDDEKPANLVYLYFQEPDSTGHAFGPNSKEVKQGIERMDNVTGYILHKLEELNITDRVNLMFLSDHGMQEVTQESIINIDNIVENANNTKYIRYGGSPVLQLLPVHENETEEIYKAFKEASKTSNFSVYLKNETSRWHYSNSRRIMPILLVADLGFVFNDYRKQNILKEHSTGTHGYDNAYPEMRPYFMAIGPLFKHDGSVQEPFENIDIFPLICQIMDLQTPPNNGSIDHILPILLHPHHRRRESTNWLQGIGGQVLGITMGVFVIVGVVGFLVFRGRKRRSSSMELH